MRETPEVYVPSWVTGMGVDPVVGYLVHCHSDDLCNGRINGIAASQRVKIMIWNLFGGADCPSFSQNQPTNSIVRCSKSARNRPLPVALTVRQMSNPFIIARSQSPSVRQLTSKWAVMSLMVRSTS